MVIESPAANQIWETCIVGTGPVGMALALEFDRLGHDVLLIESGGQSPSGDAAEASKAVIVDPDRHAPMEIAVCRALGGTSWTWGGRCVAYDDVDWIHREYVPEGNWPLQHEDIRPWYKPATEYLLCGSDEFQLPYSRQLSDGLTLDTVERWARESKVILEHRERLLQSHRIKISLNTTVVAMNFNESQDGIKSLVVSAAGGQVKIEAKRVILALGGVETTRLLLHVQKRSPRVFGGVDGPLGRYYMGHISGKIASIVFNDPKAFGDLDFKLDEKAGAFYRRRFMLTMEKQVEGKVLNTAFWPDNPPFYDPGHGSGVLSSVFLALAFPPTGRRLLSEAIRLAHTGPRPYRLGAHLKNAILGAPRGAKDIYQILRDRFLRKPKKPGFLVPNRGGKYALHYHAEQVPNGNSRVGIADETDTYGLSRAKIDLRFSEEDIESVIKSHELLDHALRTNGIGHLEYWYEGNDLRRHVHEQAADGFHQVGTTRMGNEPATSVVDSNLKVHGMSNLYVASSSVFPTTGQANSTLLAVAFGIRLVHHIHRLGAHEPEAFVNADVQAR